VSESLDTNSVVSRGYGTERFVPILLKWTLTGLPEDLLRGIYAYGYESPSAVQSRAIMQICKGRGTCFRVVWKELMGRCYCSGYDVRGYTGLMSSAIWNR